MTLAQYWPNLTWTDFRALPADAVVLALHMQSIGFTVERIRFPGTPTLSAETLIAVRAETGRSVARAAPRRLVILNSHSGQPQVADIVCRRVRGSRGHDKHAAGG